MKLDQAITDLGTAQADQAATNAKLDAITADVGRLDAEIQALKDSANTSGDIPAELAAAITSVAAASAALKAKAAAVDDLTPEPAAPASGSDDPPPADPGPGA